MVERLQKILSRWGIASRREAEQLLRDGRVRLNGEVACLGDKADPQKDCLEVDGKKIQPSQKPKSINLLLNKPLGVVSTCADPQNRRTVLDLLAKDLRDGTGIHPVGRLDINSTGALLLTNNGQLTLTLTHPRYHLPKTYQVWIDGYLSDHQLEQWRTGLMLMGQKTLPAEISLIKRDRVQTRLQVILREGKNRQIRRIVEQLGFKVVKLHRTAIGSIQLNPSAQDPLAPGKYRWLTPCEEKFLQNHLKLAQGK
jgi:23S rRNA pseudouridine2605 synthase